MLVAFYCHPHVIEQGQTLFFYDSEIFSLIILMSPRRWKKQKLDREGQVLKKKLEHSS